MPNVKFVINTIERENEIFEMVRKDWEFFKNNKIRFTWPEQPVEKEYDRKKYENYKQRVDTEWGGKGARTSQSAFLPFFIIHKIANSP